MSGEQGEALAIDEYPQPRKTLDAEPYWQGVEENRLMFQRCVQTGRAIFPPRQESPATENGGELVWEESAGKGTVYSFSTVHRPPMEVFVSKAPYTIGLIELDEGYFMFSEIVAPQDEIAIGKSVEVFYDGDNPKLPFFRLVG